MSNLITCIILALIVLYATFLFPITLIAIAILYVVYWALGATFVIHRKKNIIIGHLRWFKFTPIDKAKR